MNRLYAPWRAEYLADDSARDDGCLFCDIHGKPGDDDRNFVLVRGEHWYLIINRYPYTTGHLMVVANRHAGDFADLNAGERLELADWIARAETAVRSAYSPDGINLGANLGRSAGAGIVGHLHIHLVPRWQGDTNFMTSVGETRVISEDIQEAWRRLRAALVSGS